MNKKCFLAAAILAVAGPVCAQDVNTVNSDGYTETVEYSNDKYKVETNRFWSNWFISVGAGPQVLFSDHDRRAHFSGPRHLRGQMVHPGHRRALHVQRPVA